MSRTRPVPLRSWRTMTRLHGLCHSPSSTQVLVVAFGDAVGRQNGEHGTPRPAKNSRTRRSSPERRFQPRPDAGGEARTSGIPC